MHTILITKLRQEAILKSLPTFTRDLLREAANVIADYDIAELKPIVRGVWCNSFVDFDNNKNIIKISTEDSMGLYLMFYCSNCGILGNVKTKYCPHCGAEMWCDDDN